MDEHARSWAWFEASSGYDEDEGGNEGRHRPYRSTGEGGTRVRYVRPGRNAALYVLRDAASPALKVVKNGANLSHSNPAVNG
ncbi:hypothetical protein D3C84_726550 [compost metagenome]